MKRLLCLLACMNLAFSGRTGRLLEDMEYDHVDRINCTFADETPFLVSLLKAIAKRYLKLHTTVIIYDDHFFYHSRLKTMLETLLRTYDYPIRHGRINTTKAKPTVPEGLLEGRENEQMSFIALAKETEIAAEAIRDYTGENTYSIVIPQASIYSVKSFLRTKVAADITNLLVLVDPMIKVDSFTQKKSQVIKECDILMFTHDIVTGSIAGSLPKVVTAWRRDHFTRQVPLFPPKFDQGLGGKLLVVSATQIPPFVFRKQGQDSGHGYSVTAWEGIEPRLMRVVAMMMNFSISLKEPELNSAEDAGEQAVEELLAKRADMALGGVYLTPERIKGLSFSMPHTIDCANFISLASTALPKYRAIMGPFLWDTWLAVTAVYLFAMFPIAFSVWHTIRPLLDDFWEVENMFWYVFGTFTNCFTFVGENSWGKSDKSATKLFIGTYWIFTIIITACYTGSIVAFITLPVFPDTIDSARQLVEEDYKISVLASGGWHSLFNESTDPIMKKLNKSLDTVPDVFAGLRNVTKNVHEWRQSAFLGSRKLLEYTIRTNFTPGEDSKRLLFHLSEECFLPLMVSVVLPRRTPFLEHLNNAVERVLQSGFMTKIINEVEWEVYRSSTGKLLRVHRGLKGVPEDRELNLDDTQGMFLLLGAGFAIAIFVLILEIIHWARMDVKNRQFGEPTLKERAIDKLKEHWATIYACLLAPANNGISYIRGRRVSSAFGEYVTRPYTPWHTTVPSPTVQSPSPPPPNGTGPSAPPLGESLSMEQLYVPQDKPVRMMSI